jgi:hypothetical protein
VTEVEQVTGDDVAGLEVVAEDAVEAMIGGVVLDQDERDLEFLHLQDELGADVAVVGDDESTCLLGESLDEQGRGVGGGVVHVEQDLVPQALRLRLKAPDDVAVKEIEEDGSGPLLDQQADGLTLCRRRRRREFVAELRDGGPDAFARLGADAGFAANDERDGARRDIRRRRHVPDVRPSLAHLLPSITPKARQFSGQQCTSQRRGRCISHNPRAFLAGDWCVLTRLGAGCSMAPSSGKQVSFWPDAYLASGEDRGRRARSVAFRDARGGRRGGIAPSMGGGARTDSRRSVHGPGIWTSFRRLQEGAR